MNAGAGLLLPFNNGYRQEVAPTQHLPFLDEEDFHTSFFAIKIDGFLIQDNLVQISCLSEYDLGGEGDLFKAPEPILEEPVLALDPDTAAMSMISSNGNLISPEAIKVTHMESIQNEGLLSEVFYDCKKDLLARSAIIEPSPEASDVKIPALQPETVPGVEEENKLVMEGPVQKRDSFRCLSSADYINGCNMRPSFFEFEGMNLGAAFGIRRAYSEGDIQTLGSSKPIFGNVDIVRSFLQHSSTNVDVKIEDKIEERSQKLSRYRKKRTKRNFGKKIKYACRKALADSQPRVRGRFAKSEEGEIAKLHQQNADIRLENRLRVSNYQPCTPPP
ncbi:uncharacterized protein LOC103702588 [Phoenix dactylifera]|uniref:Uncharacterized protein LOC103702588 n=1 Tax=Phoenix dactylifera TaxID=42345 RepID=A0A8B9AQC7_PHODC|nr:uncharacterized protein LOC103702588 [Phoenix dactylifera]